MDGAHQQWAHTPLNGVKSPFLFRSLQLIIGINRLKQACGEKEKSIEKKKFALVAKFFVVTRIRLI